jgi:hypothetical protein
VCPKVLALFSKPGYQKKKKKTSSQEKCLILALNKSKKAYSLTIQML